MVEADIRQSTGEIPKEYSVGENGVVVFDNRNTSLLAASIRHATDN